MNRAEANRFRRACRRCSEQLGTPGFEAAIAEFWQALAALKKREQVDAN